MTKTEGKSASAAVKDILLSNPDGLHEVIRAVMQPYVRTLNRRLPSLLPSSRQLLCPAQVAIKHIGFPHSDHGLEDRPDGGSVSG
ncbi:hypothetical protein LB543_22725 [Mesorhizobium sp. ESP7-2]|uniref:hypothetical protein n=1 Tax=Mesorhizobium sp. ESP7-2 TaxID=2876622 RepID=UPI001CC98313|nr:hypothetical protein [Mesorhizobium sp. ESP7-2]MBZ9709532.1 hypothetical protein [Mesorhizobium sp. ESP7-2]